MSIDVVARADEIAIVETFLDRPATGPRALVLMGAAGIGKSTVWLAGVAEARARGFRVLVSRPAELERTLPNVVLSDLFGEVTATELAGLPAPRRRALETTLLRHEGPDHPVDPRTLGVAVQTLLRFLADDQPLLLAIDDDQWLDPSSAGTLGFAMRRLEGVPIRLLLARRTAEVPVAALEDTIEPTSVERIEIGPLSLGAIQAVLQQRFDMTFRRPTLARLHEVSGGNPFYALELARVQSADPARDATLRLAVPPSLELLVGGRLQALAPPLKRPLLLIAAHGRFPVGLLDALDVTLETLDPAREANVIEIDSGVIRFVHPMLASTLYQTARPAERRDAHRRLASVVDDPLDRARHLALAADAPDDELAAALESASGVARVRGLPFAAAELAEHALRLTPSEAAEDRHRRAIVAARAHLSAAEGGRARTIADDVVAAASAGPRRAEALILRSELEPPGTSLPLLEAALTEAAGTPQLEAAIHAALAETGFFSASKEAAWVDRHALASLRLADTLDDDALRADALSILALLRFLRCDRDALQTAERAYRLAASTAEPRHVARAVWSMGFVLAWQGPADMARAWLEGRLAEWSDRDERVVREIVAYLALVEIWSGRWLVARVYADQVLEMSIQYGSLTPYDYLPAALVALHRGELDAAREHSRRALLLGEGQQLELLFGIVAICDLWSGDTEAALATFVLAERAADFNNEEEPALRFWRADYAEALLRAGRPDDAARLIADWEAAAKKLERERVLAQVIRCRGLIAAARGDLHAAVTLLEDAVRKHEAAGDPFGRARAQLALGSAQRRARKKSVARTALEAALAQFEALGAGSWVTVARGELAKIGGRVRIEGLSPSERSVATLVAEGRTNREIASALFLGERTVASHLTHIYAKLGIRSRTELVRHLRPQSAMSVEDPGKVQTS